MSAANDSGAPVTAVDHSSTRNEPYDQQQDKERQDKDMVVVRTAYDNRDVEASKAEHAKRHTVEPHIGGASEYVKSIVFGGLDGITTTFAIVTAAAGGGESWRSVLIFGFANALADAWSMGFGEYISSAAERDLAVAERDREEWEVENNLEGEKAEMIDVYMQKGFPEEDAKTIVDVISKDKRLFVDIMMVEELGILPEDDDAWAPFKQAIVMFCSFVLFGIFPLLAYLGGTGGGTDYIFGISCGITALGLLILGAAKGFLTGSSVPRTAVTMLFQGAISGGVSFGVGVLVDYIVKNS